MTLRPLPKSSPAPCTAWRRRNGRAAAFTLLELLVASAVLVVILVLTMSIVSITTGVLQRSRSRIDAFQSSRAAFSAMTQRVSQATLNTYWDYVNDADEPRTLANMETFLPAEYRRQSELHLVSSPAQRDGTRNLLLPTGRNTVTHALFFQAPLGWELLQSPVPMPHLLNASGYFVEFGDDSLLRPQFLVNQPLIAPRHRFRLFEMLQPSEHLGIYDDDPAAGPNDWFLKPLALAATPVTRVLAENVVALIIHPQRSPNDPTPAGQRELAPGYVYDSRGYKVSSTPLTQAARNQLPPTIKVTVVAIDEPSAARLQAKYGNQRPPLGLETLFAEPSAPGDSGYEQIYLQDLRTLESKLQAENLNYRIFTTSVGIQQAKWSED